MTHRRAPRPLGAALDRATHEWSPGTLLAELQHAWPSAVGPAIAAEATPASERGGVLTIVCSASVWAQELDLMGPTIVEQLNAVITGAKVTRIRCVTTPPRDNR
jgi:predicted nucleic acid-binding Zn ribbon protein